MRLSLRSLRIEVEQTTVRVHWANGEIPPDGGRQLVTDLLAASAGLLDLKVVGGKAPHEVGSDPSEGDP